MSGLKACDSQVELPGSRVELPGSQVELPGARLELPGAQVVPLLARLEPTESQLTTRAKSQKYRTKVQEYTRLARLRQRTVSTLWRVCVMLNTPQGKMFKNLNKRGIHPKLPEEANWFAKKCTKAGVDSESLTRLIVLHRDERGDLSPLTIAEADEIVFSVVYTFIFGKGASAEGRASFIQELRLCQPTQRGRMNDTFRAGLMNRGVDVERVVKAVKQFVDNIKSRVVTFIGPFDPETGLFESVPVGHHRGSIVSVIEPSLAPANTDEPFTIQSWVPEFHAPPSEDRTALTPVDPPPKNRSRKRQTQMAERRALVEPLLRLAKDFTDGAISKRQFSASIAGLTF